MTAKIKRQLLIYFTAENHSNVRWLRVKTTDTDIKFTGLSEIMHKNHQRNALQKG